MAITIPPRNELYTGRRNYNPIAGQTPLNTGLEQGGARRNLNARANAYQKASANTGISEDSVETLAGIEQSTAALRASADRLVKDGTLYDADQKDRAYEAADRFVSDYNALLDSTGKSVASSIGNKMSSLTYMTAKNRDALGQIGITVGDDARLSVNEDVFRSAPADAVKKVFAGAGSYGYSVSAQAAMIDYQANYEAAKSGTYGPAGTFGSTNSVGSLFDVGV